MSAVLEHPSANGTVVIMGNRALVAADGEVTELSDKAFEAALNAAMGVMGQHRMVTTGQAAKLLNCSPRTVARILDSGLNCPLPAMARPAAVRSMWSTSRTTSAKNANACRRHCPP